MKNVVFCLICLLSISSLNAQEVKFGAKAGLNLSTISFKVPQVTVGGSNAAGEEQKNSFAVGFHVGGLAELLLTDKFSVQAEISYSIQGSKLKSEDVQVQDFGFVKTTTTASTKTDLQTNVLNIPILGKYYFTEKLFAVAGPQFGLLLSAKSESSGTGTTTFTFAGNTTTQTQDLSSPSQDVKKGFNTLNVSVGIGAGYFITEHIFAEARYNLGLTNVAKSETNPFTGQNLDIVSKSSLIQFSAGYRF